MKRQMRNKMRSVIAVVLCLAMAFSLCACSGSGGGQGTQTAQTTQAAQGTQAAQEQKETTAAPAETTAPAEAEAAEPAGKNTDNSFATIAAWTASGLINHYNSTTSCNTFPTYVVEGLWNNVRTTDEVYCQLAQELPTHSTGKLEDYKDVIGEDLYDYYAEKGITEVGVSTGKIRPEAKWQNGEDFTAKDVWAYYYLVPTILPQYLAGIKVVDDKTIEFIWNPLATPATDKIKDFLLSNDRSGTVKYDEFAQFVDAAYDIFMGCEVNTDENIIGNFGRILSAEPGEELTTVRKNFNEYNPSWYIATGPFKLETFSATQILLTKNEYYWNAANIGFDKIKLYAPKDNDQTYQMLADGTLDYVDGSIPEDTLKQILAQNEDLVNLKFPDSGALGLIFNFEKSVFSDLKVRQAFNYIFDREAVAVAAGQLYAPVVYYSPMGMPPQEARRQMSEKHFNELTVYSHDPDKAAQLLTEAGWEKRDDGFWYRDGQLVELNLGASNEMSTGLVGEASAAQLNAFGIKCNFLRSDNFDALSLQEDSPYDLMVRWCGLNGSFNYPGNSYDHFEFEYSKFAHLDRYSNEYEDEQKRGKLKLEFDGLDGDTAKYAFIDYYKKFFMMDQDEVTYMADVFNTGLSKLCLGVTMYQTVSRATYNVAHVSGVPLKEYWSVDRNVAFVPTPDDENIVDAASANLWYSWSYKFINGYYQPNVP